MQPKSVQGLSAGITTSSAELVLVVDLVGAVTGDTGGGHISLLHAVEGDARGVVLGADLSVAGVRGVVVERGDLGEVLAVRLAVVLDSLYRC
jgi:hypothetical protein